ncbi:DUF1622 domain-containing protein [Crocosphaera chwakensis]|uniref:DUF1622 domain-containing protein n=1 Tax=Crocosphaera chwakensis CCY0110 TaxID=391612 RepID=A3ILT5_9CHRO|nr:DUF1622 domain-containing protein [Crocosphaera chwakensis]EAZ92736.1 hypothetical protein CY0110_24256 [Crocosphaera chwakensis CCY0110]
MSETLALTVRMCNELLTSLCQLLALFVIFVGIMRALIIFLKDLLFKPQTTEAFQRSRLAMGYSFSLGLSFLVGASILKTMISSRWDDLARLILIIAVRTILNYLLTQTIASSDQKESLSLSNNNNNS